MDTEYKKRREEEVGLGDAILGATILAGSIGYMVGIPIGMAVASYYGLPLTADPGGMIVLKYAVGSAIAGGSFPPVAYGLYKIGSRAIQKICEKK